MSYSNGLLSDQSYQTANKYVQRGLPGVGFKLTVMGDYDMQNKKLTNVKSGTDSNDAVNKSQLDATTNLLHGSRAGDVVNDKAVIYSNTGAVHANSLYIEDPPNQGNSNEVRIMTEHQSYPNIHLNIPDLHNFDGHGVRPKSELMVTSVEQTVTGKKVFENIEVHDPTSNNQAANKNYADTKLSLTGGTMTGDLILPLDNYPVQGNTNKAVSYETQREIFLSRKESFPMQAEINMNNNFIQNVATPTTSHQGANKGYCDYNFLNRQKGGRIMGSLSMNQNDLFEIPDTPKFGSSAVNKSYVEGEIAKIPQGSNSDTSSFLKLDGSRAMSGNLDMDNHKIVKLQDPTEDTDAASKFYIDQKLEQSHILSSSSKNEFVFLNDPSKISLEYNVTSAAFDNFPASPHINKKAYLIDLKKNVGTNNYQSRMGFNIQELPLGLYTIIFEFYPPEMNNIQISCQATSAYIHKQVQKNFSTYSKLLVQFHNNNKNNPDKIFFTMHGDTIYVVSAFLILYGIKDWVDAINPKLYDHIINEQMFEFDSLNMLMKTNLDLNNNKILNISDGTDANDAINKGQFDTLKNKFDSHQFYIKNHLYMSIFSYRFYDLKEPIKFNYTLPNVSGIEPGLSILSSGQGHLSINELDPISGLQFNRSIRIIIDLGYTINQVTPYTIMLSMTLKDEITIYFTDDHSTKYYPVYKIDQTMLLLMIITSDGIMQHKSYSSQFNDTQVMLWIHFNPVSNRYRISLANHAVADFISTPPSSFSTNKLRINPGNNIINKICYQNQYISADLHYTQILFEEKKNGSHFE